MSRRKSSARRQQAAKSPKSEATPAAQKSPQAEPPAFERLPPPVAHWPVILLSLVLLVGWMVFLAYIAYG